MLMTPYRQSDCLLGHHRPRRIAKDRGNPEVQRSVCRDCGCALVRVRATRKWIYSGLLG